MRHCSDDDLVLYYYREEARPGRHLEVCAACRQRFGDLALALGEVPPPAPPARGEQYGLEVWQRIRPRLPERAPWWHVDGAARPWLTRVAAGVVLAGLGFTAGRFWPGPDAAPRVEIGPREPATDIRRRVLVLSAVDHLDRSARVLTEIMNASAGADLSAEQQWAVDLVAANRLFRQDAAETDEASLAMVLDELERVLLDIVHRPEDAGAMELQRIRGRIDAAALLFKMRVMSLELRQRELAPATRALPTIG